MLTKRAALGLLFLFFSFSAYAKKEVVFFGGGGEPATPGTIFDKTYQDFGLFSSQSGWSSRSYFDGGHPQSEALANTMSKGQNKPMTAFHVNNEIANLKKRIQSGDLKSGDQLMVTIATHGLPTQPPQIAHSVAATDGIIDLGQLKELRDLAEANGVQLGIVDYSCHSGVTLNLGSDKTCVVSAASHNVGYVNAGEEIGKNIKKGSNLEEAFLMGRKAPSPGAPQISTEAGRKAYAATQFLSESMRERTSIAPAMAQDAKDCYGVNSNPFKKLVSQLRDIEKNKGLYHQARIRLGLTDSEVEPIIKKLESSMQSYENARQHAQESFVSVNSIDNGNKCKNVLNYQLCGSLKQWEFGYKQLEKKAQAGSLSQKESAELKAYKEQVSSPEFQQWKTKQAEFDKKAHDIYWEADKVAQAERDVYEKLYQHFSAQEKKPNPCRNFVL
ncbi:hypothetical protein [Bdellovibrio reynosensis]|uniref:Uncharacterized protein n=1 Tax=Bdellovibrio reynosensis TaxID=2835041 RepID=A0ABY4C5T3_9BACT|nr:hypothetical protein [Bdellovibrio reynosensis]UOF00322.1 hypothetical protein MNR06_11490 [Bdellovibrio reynosensis]